MNYLLFTIITFYQFKKINAAYEYLKCDNSKMDQSFEEMIKKMTKKYKCPSFKQKIKGKVTIKKANIIRIANSEKKMDKKTIFDARRTPSEHIDPRTVDGTAIVAKNTVAEANRFFACCPFMFDGYTTGTWTGIVVVDFTIFNCWE